MKAHEKVLAMILGALVAGTLLAANFYNLYTDGTVTGVLKANGTGQGTLAVAADVSGLWSGTCNNTTFLRGDGSCAAGGATFANPSASLGLTAVNGSATTAMRSDGAPALSQAIAPTWTGSHIFSPASGEAIHINAASSQPGIRIQAANSSYGLRITNGSFGGDSFGLDIEAASTSSDRALKILGANTSSLFEINGLGAIYLNSSAGAAPQAIISAGTGATASWGQPYFSGTSASIGGGALVAGACAGTTVTVTGATTAMVVEISPVADPGTGNYWQGFVSAANTVTTRICAAVAGTPTATTYNVRVFP